MKRHNREEHGFVAIEFVAGLCFLMLPVAFLVLVFPTWWEHISMARVASREAAREYVLTGDQARAQHVVSEISDNYHLKDGELALQLQGDPRKRGGTISASVTAKIPLTSIPLLNLDVDAFSFTQSHREVVDLYRSQS